MAGSAAEKYNQTAAEMPEKKTARRSLIKKTEQAPAPLETAPQIEKRSLPENVQRMDADGSWVSWDVKESADKALIFMTDETDTRHVNALPRAEFDVQEKAMEAVKKLEQYWEPYFDIATEGNPEQAEFFSSNKGRILEIAARMMQKHDLPENMAVAMTVADINNYKENAKTVKSIDYSRVARELAKGMNEITMDRFSANETEEDEKLRAQSKLAHALTASSLALRRMSPREKGPETQMQNMLLDLAGDKTALSVLVDGEIDVDFTESLENVNTRAAKVREEALSMLRKGDASTKELEKMSAKVVQIVKDLRSAQARGSLHIDEVPLKSQKYPEPSPRSIQDTYTAPENLPVAEEEMTLEAPGRNRKSSVRQKAPKAPLNEDSTMSRGSRGKDIGSRLDGPAEEKKPGVISRLGRWFTDLLNG